MFLGKKINNTSIDSLKKSDFLDIWITGQMFWLKSANSKKEHKEILLIKKSGFWTLWQLAEIWLYFNWFLYRNMPNPVVSFFNWNKIIWMERSDAGEWAREKILSYWVNKKILDEILRKACKLVYGKNENNKNNQLQTSFNFISKKDNYCGAIKHIKDFIQMMKRSDKNPVLCDIKGMISTREYVRLSLELMINFHLIDEMDLFEKKYTEMIEKMKDGIIKSHFEKNEIKIFLESIITILEIKIWTKSNKVIEKISKKIPEII